MATSFIAHDLFRYCARWTTPSKFVVIFHMIDPMVSLAFAVYSNKGAYAVLLGSGISRASGIPTGWEVVLDLIKRVAASAGKDEKEKCEANPAEWFRNKHGEEPDYSKLLDGVAKTPVERQQLLRSYFEPTPEERSDGRKLPTAAHKAIAQLVADGYLRVIITTNFDQLMEMALEDAGIVPTVISNTDQLKGALPLVHSGATIIKLHGDYRDTRIKNTEKELATYDKALNGLLDRILDEYGLIVSGWSGEWDVALRSAIERCPSRRFTTFWGTVGALAEKGRALAERRAATILQTQGADHLFVSLCEKVQALADMAAPHPLSAKMAAATVKRYLVDPTAKIRLHDLVHEETERLFREINTSVFGDVQRLDQRQEIQTRLEKYGTHCETLLSVLVTGCYWGDAESTNLWVASLQRIAKSAGIIGSHSYLVNLRRYPALVLLYGAGLAALAAGNYEMLASILTKPKLKSTLPGLKNESICSQVFPLAVNWQGYLKVLPGFENSQFPLNDYLLHKLRDFLREYLPDDSDYEALFDRFEYLYALVFADLNHYSPKDVGWWAPTGWFQWRNKTIQKITAEMEASGAEWPPLKAGLFGGSMQQAQTAQIEFAAFLDS